MSNIYISVSRPVAIKFVQKLDLHGRERDQIAGVAKLQNAILVIYHIHPTVIQVFQDQHPFCLQKIIKQHTILCPEDIVSSEKHQCVYVSDKKCIWKITSKTDDHFKVTKWYETNAQFTMSVSSDGQLVIVGNNDFGSFLEIYGSEVQCLYFIKLPNDIQNPRQAVETSTGNFVILHDYTSESNEVELRISELTRSGWMLHRFIPRNDEQQLNVPYQLSLDSDDRVLIADHWKKRMILLNSDLTWNQACLIKNKNDEEQRPKRMHYDAIKQQLIVAANVSSLKGGVNVYVCSFHC